MYTCVFVSVYTRVCTGLCRLRGGLVVHPEEGGNRGYEERRRGREEVLVVVVGEGGVPL